MERRDNISPGIKRQVRETTKFMNALDAQMKQMARLADNLEFYFGPFGPSKEEVKRRKEKQKLLARRNKLKRQYDTHDLDIWGNTIVWKHDWLGRKVRIVYEYDFDKAIRKEISKIIYNRDGDEIKQKHFWSNLLLR